MPRKPPKNPSSLLAFVRKILGLLVVITALVGPAYYVAAHVHEQRISEANAELVDVKLALEECGIRGTEIAADIAEHVLRPDTADRLVHDIVRAANSDCYPDGLSTKEWMVASIAWQLKSQCGYAEVLCGRRAFSVQTVFDRSERGKHRTQFTYGERPNPLLGTFGGEVGRDPTDDELA